MTDSRDLVARVARAFLTGSASVDAPHVGVVSLLAICAGLGATVTVEGGELVIEPADRVPAALAVGLAEQEQELIAAVALVGREFDQLEGPSPVSSKPRLRVV